MKKRNQVGLIIVMFICFVLTLLLPLGLRLLDRMEQKRFEDEMNKLIEVIDSLSSKIKIDKNEAIFTYEDGSFKSDGTKEQLQFDSKYLKSGVVKMNQEKEISYAFSYNHFCLSKSYKQTGYEIKRNSKPFWCHLSSSEEEKEDKSGANEPELVSSFIPVKYQNGHWVTVQSNDPNWYNYDDKKWANVVTVDQRESKIKEKYFEKDGAVKIDVEVDFKEVVGMFVWIPRFQYQLFNVNGNKLDPRLIDIQFVKSSKEKETGSTNGSFLTHPAFTYQGNELSGFWISKFPMTGDITLPTFKPDQSLMISVNIKQGIDLIAKVTKEQNPSGLDPNEIKGHYIKNMEWGAVAYLTNSKYGNSQIEKNDTIKTGGGSYQKNQSQSSTKNIYGVYDMAGIAQYTLGVYQENWSNSGITNPLQSHEFERYQNPKNIASCYDGGLLGDATKETIEKNGSWNHGNANFVTSDSPFFIRGKESIFSFDSGMGQPSFTGIRAVFVIS